MWRGVVSVILVLIGVSLADVQFGDDAIKSVQRLKRTPYYDYNPDCPPDYYHHHHPHPPFWPPPPHPPPPPPPPYWPPPPPPPRQEVIYVESQDKPQAYTQEQQEPCTTCQSASNAVSNAQSDSGQAIAVAIAKAKSN